MNPYGGKKILASTGEPALEAMRAGGKTVTGATSISSGPAFSNMGDHFELNASSKVDLMKQIAFLLHNYGGDVKTAQLSPREKQAQAEERMATLHEAMADKSGQSFTRIGEVITDEIVETMDREGFARTILAVRPTPKGQDARVRVRKRDVVAFMITSDVHTTEQRIRQYYV